jgi:hypothetical protein
MPIINLAIIVFLLAMMYMGSIQGLFSAFLHMMLVIAVGTLAFAIWEPLTLGLLIGRIPLMAWAVGLLVPFAILLVIFRMASDKLVPANMHFAGIVTNLGGAACGLVSGILTSGIVLIGVGLLPFSPDLGGFQPFGVAGRGQVMLNEDGQLWVPVHSIAFNFYSGLSGGAFSTSTPMRDYMPDLDDQISLVRLRGENTSIVAAPQAVNVTGLYIQDTTALTDGASPATATTLGGEFTQPGNRLVMVDTEWSLTKNTYDGDSAIRLSVSQIRLGIRPIGLGGGGTQTIGPVGFTKAEGDQRLLYPFDADGVTAFGIGQTDTFAWVFLVPTDQEPTFLFVRKLRLELPKGEDVVSDPQEVLAALGSPPVPETVEEGGGLTANAQTPGGPTKVGFREGRNAGTYAIDVSIDNTFKAISKNTTSGLTIDEGLVRSGMGTARKSPTNIGQRNRVNAFEVPSHKLMVKVRVGPDKAFSLLGGALKSAAELNEILLKDARGESWYVSAYVWVKENGDQEIKFDSIQSIRNAKLLPINQMGPKDELYLYFLVNKKTQLVSYQIGSAMTQDFEPPLVVQKP